jgi:hypothetical protein
VVRGNGSDPASDLLVLGMIPAGEVTPKLLAQARAGGFDDLLLECGTGRCSAAHIRDMASTLNNQSIDH